MDITKSFKYYDPLYDVITIKPHEISQTSGRKGWHSAILGKPIGLLENQIIKILETYEMSRLNFLKQSGLAFLVFPSSTHTRFAHCLGTYYLGEMALNRSWVEVGGKLYTLRNWVEHEKGLKDEFLLSLLLHDVGHFPFSHILENNTLFYDSELKNLLLKHEEISCDLIRGVGRFSDYKNWLIKQGFDIQNDDRFIYSKFKDVSTDPFKGTHAGIICWLIDGNKENFNLYIPDESILTNKKSIRKNDLFMLKRLTSGLLDLDRMDHYRRDSYFMGVKLAQFNVLSLLDDIILTEDGIKLKSDGVSHAISLLQSKEIMISDIFENPTNLAYEVMLNFCITFYINQFEDKEIEEKVNELIFLTDEELFVELSKITDPKVRKIVFRIKNRQPYQLVKKYERVHQKIKDRKSLEELKQNLFERFKHDLKNDDSLLLFRIPKGYGPKEKMKEEWLDLNLLMDEKGTFLNHHGYNRETDYFNAKQNEGIHKFWIFLGVEDTSLREKIIAEISKEIET